MFGMCIHSCHYIFVHICASISFFQGVNVRSNTKLRSRYASSLFVDSGTVSLSKLRMPHELERQSLGVVPCPIPISDTFVRTHMETVGGLSPIRLPHSPPELALDSLNDLLQIENSSSLWSPFTALNLQGKLVPL